MPLAIYSSVSEGGPMALNAAIALSVVLVVTSFAVILVAKRLAARALYTPTA